MCSGSQSMRTNSRANKTHLSFWVAKLRLREPDADSCSTCEHHRPFIIPHGPQLSSALMEMSCCSLHIIQAISLCSPLLDCCLCVKDRSIIGNTRFSKLAGWIISDGVIVREKRGNAESTWVPQKLQTFFYLWVLAEKRRKSWRVTGQALTGLVKTKCSAQSCGDVFQLTVCRHSFLKQLHKLHQGCSDIRHAGSRVKQKHRGSSEPVFQIQKNSQHKSKRHNWLKNNVGYSKVCKMLSFLWVSFYQ